MSADAEWVERWDKRMARIEAECAARQNDARARVLAAKAEYFSEGASTARWAAREQREMAEELA